MPVAALTLRAMKKLEATKMSEAKPACAGPVARSGDVEN
jgi:hypothetical protein